MRKKNEEEKRRKSKIVNYFYEGAFKFNSTIITKSYYQLRFLLLLALNYDKKN